MFLKFVEMLENISMHKSRNQIILMLAELFEGLDPLEAQKSAYLVLGTLAPAYQPLRFNLAEKQLLSFLTLYLQQKYSQDAERFFLEAYREQGDLGQALLLTMTTCLENNFLQYNNSFLQIFEDMKLLSELSGIGSVEEKRERIFNLLDKLTPIEQKYLIRIIAGQLRLGFSTGSLLDAFATIYCKQQEKPLKDFKKLVEDNYNVCADAGLLIYNLKTFGVAVLEDPIPKIGIPVCPATAERVSDLDELLQRQSNLIIQKKLDGLRLQIHKGPNGAFLFSRNLLDVSHMFPEIMEAFKKVPFDNFILDGEILGYNKETAEDLTFQQTSQRRRKHNIDGVSNHIPTRVYLFDILMFDGNALLQRKYFERRNILVNHFVGHDPAITVLEQQEYNCDLSNLNSVDATKKKISDFFYDVIDSGFEGILAKRQEGLYQVGKRGFNWIKIKHLTQYKLADTIDAVIIGYYFGKGRRAALGMGAFLVALFNEDTQTYQTLAKVGTGLSDNDLMKLTKVLNDFALNGKPKSYQVDTFLTPDVWVDGKIVVEVDADEITVSKVHTAAFGIVVKDRGLALRFPRMLKIREDKSISDSTKISELISLTNFKSVYKE